MRIRMLELTDTDVQTKVSVFEPSAEMKKNGWRLPTLQEMIMIYNDQSWNEKINLEKNWYLIDQASVDVQTKEAYLSDGTHQYQFDFSTGEHTWIDCAGHNHGLASVRLIRAEIPILNLSLSNNQLSNLVLKATDYGEMSWTDAQEAVKKIPGGDWRLPTIEELDSLYAVSEFCRGEYNLNLKQQQYYWAGNSAPDSGSDNQAAALYVSRYEPDSMAGYYRNFDWTEKFRVRAVRSLE